MKNDGTALIAPLPTPALSMIVALDQKRAIGKGGALAWHIRDDLRFFKHTTKDAAIIMGRKTYDSINRPLPDRFNIIITRDQAFKADRCLVVHSKEKALTAAHAYCFATRQSQIYITGGAEIYAQCIDICQQIYVTEVATEIDGADTFFPPLQDNTWTRTPIHEISKSDQNDFAAKIYLLKRNRTGTSDDKCEPVFQSKYTVKQ